MHCGVLRERPDMKGRTRLSDSQNQSPSWRVLYKSPVPKRSGDLQWHVLHCAMVKKVFVAQLRTDVSTVCIRCHVPDTLFYCFCDCSTDNPLSLLDGAFSSIYFFKDDVHLAHVDIF